MIRLYNSTNRPIDPRLEKIIKKYQFSIDLIISYGGDGTLLGAEREYPSIPKLAIRSSKNCQKCHHVDDLKNILSALASNQLRPISFIKLETNINSHHLLSLNEFCLKSSKPNTALRFSYKVGDIVVKDVIADGIIVATPFGSTGYFQSITRTVFSQGIGVAVINPTNCLNNMIVPDSSTVSITIDRVEAQLFSDNNPDILNLPAETTINIGKSSKSAFIY